MSDELVHCTVADGVATITLDSPGNRNALSKHLLRELHAKLDRAERDDVRVTVLTNTGNTFCAGADLRERSDGPADSTPMVAACQRLMSSRQPTIAAVKGFVRAGGVGLMCSCDLVVVPASADFAFTEVRIGVAPAIISVPILRRCTPAHLAGPFLTGEMFDAAHARAIGLVSHVAQDADDVDRIVSSMCVAMLRAGPKALQATKQILQTVSSEDPKTAFPRMQHLSETLFTSAEAAEGMRAFIAKTSPNWAIGTS